MALHFVSDLHITGAEDPLYGALLRLIRERATGGDTLVLGGDIFDLWVGNQPIFRKRYHQFLDAVGQAKRRSVDIHYIEGNHDFLLETAFPSDCGIKVHSEELALHLHDRSFLLLHGDTLNRADLKYLALRTAFRSQPFELFVQKAPGQWLDRFGNWSSHYSRGKKPALPQDWPEKRLRDLRATYRSAASERIAQGYDFVLAGHCHDLDEAFLEVGGRVGWYFNNGFPRVHGSYLSWNGRSEKLERLPLNGN